MKKDSLYKQAVEIRDEVKDMANTHTRVGRLFVDIVSVLYGGVHDLGVVSSRDAALNSAAQPEITDDSEIRMILWRTSNATTGGGQGDGGTIFQERRGSHYVIQWMMYEGAGRVSKARLIITGGNRSVGEWQTIIMPSGLEYNTSDSSVYGRSVMDAREKLFTIPFASNQQNGMMTKGDKANLDRLVSTLLRGVRDLGVVSSSSKAFELAAEETITDDSRIRIILWRTSDVTTGGGSGDGGTIFQERRGSHYVIQWMMYEGAGRVSKSRLITTGGNRSVGGWKTIVMPSGMEYDASDSSVYGRSVMDAREKLFTIPAATDSQNGLMPKGDKAKLDSLKEKYFIDNIKILSINESSSEEDISTAIGGNFDGLYSMLLNKFVLRDIVFCNFDRITRRYTVLAPVYVNAWEKLSTRIISFRFLQEDGSALTVEVSKVLAGELSCTRKESEDTGFPEFKELMRAPVIGGGLNDLVGREDVTREELENAGIAEERMIQLDSGFIQNFRLMNNSTTLVFRVVSYEYYHKLRSLVLEYQDCAIGVYKRYEIKLAGSSYSVSYVEKS